MSLAADCPICGAQNPQGSRFCHECGVPLPEAVVEVFCPACGAENAAERSCAQCGLPMSTSEEASLATPEAPPLPLRDLEGLIRESFRVYRRQFTPLVILALVPQIPAFISLVVPEWLSWLFSLVGFLMAVVALGAAYRLVALDFLGRKADPFECFGRAWGRAGPLILAGVLLMLILAAAAGLVIILVGIPLFFYLMVSLFFAEGAIMLEGKGAVDALKRSMNLVRGSWWRVFGIGVAFVLVTLVLLILALIPIGIASLVSQSVGIACAVFIAPVSMVGTALVYFDLRARKEGYSLERMAAEVGS